MASQGQKAVSESPLRLAIEALHGRARALSEYYSVYRSGAGPRARGRRHQRVRELRHDIVRLQAWAWYLSVADRRPWWWRALYRLSGVFGRDQREQAGRRRHHRAGIQRLSSFSVVDRAYVAHMEDFQGRLLTLQLAQQSRSDPRFVSSSWRTPCEGCPNTAVAWPKTPAGWRSSAGRWPGCCGCVAGWVWIAASPAWWIHERVIPRP